METWIVREAEERDAAAMLRFAEAVFREPDVDLPVAPDEFQLTVEEEEAIVRRHRDTSNMVFLLAFAPSGELVGMLNAHGGTRRALRHACEFGMSVAAAYRNRGVGSSLLAALLAWAPQAGVTRIELSVYARNAAAIHLYEKFGFEVEGRRRHAIFQDGTYHDALIMARLL